MTGVSKQGEGSSGSVAAILPINLGVIPNATQWSEESHVIHF